MAGGGQRGLSFVGEPMVFAIVASVLITVLLQLQLGCFGGSGSDAMDKYDQECKQEYADANDGNDETEVKTAILEQPDCMAVVATLQAERRQDQQQDLQEAQP